MPYCIEQKSIYAKTFISIPDDIKDIAGFSDFKGVKDKDSMLFDTANDLKSGQALENNRTFTHDINLSVDAPERLLCESTYGAKIFRPSMKRLVA